MKLKFKKQAYQTESVNAVIDCFIGQPNVAGIPYRQDVGRGQLSLLHSASDMGFRNHELQLTAEQLLYNIHHVQSRNHLPFSKKLGHDKKTQFSTKNDVINLDIEMETGTGKTYCYIKTLFELNRRFGWSKFIIVVPSIAIREGVAKSIDMTTDHFLEDYHKKIRFFIYNSKQLHHLESFSSDASINVMIINVQAFNATGKDARRIYEERDDFQSRKPIDIISSNRPILILDEPQKMEGAKTVEALKKFKPLMILRYSATHKTEHHKIYRLDALDAYQQKLVKKIAVRGISVKHLPGTNAYLYLQSIDISPKRPPIACVEMEVKHKKGIKRTVRKLGKNDNLFNLSGLEQYKGFVVADINANTGTLSFINGIELQVGEFINDISEAAFSRIQIRETIKAHFEKEQHLFTQGIKVLSLFFIDSVAKYRRYDEQGAQLGDYAQVFEEEYTALLANLLTTADTAYSQYLQKIAVAKTHNGYFSIDKKNHRLIDPTLNKKLFKTEGEYTDDVDAYDLILKDKERLLSLSEPVRFIFSHSALREGWDNPNVFVICTLKKSHSDISRRQEVGRGMRIAVNQTGERMDDPITVHQINVLTVVTGESYTEFVGELQQEMCESLSARPRPANTAYFQNKTLITPTGEVTVTKSIAEQVYTYLSSNHYVDEHDCLSSTYLKAKETGHFAHFPSDLAPYSESLLRLIDSTLTDKQLPKIEDERKVKINRTNANFEKKEFKELWSRINKKAIYTVQFNSQELIQECITELNNKLHITPMQYVIEQGEQTTSATADDLSQGEGFKINKISTINHPNSIVSSVKYDLVGQLVEGTHLTRLTIVSILQGIESSVFAQYPLNPEDFIAQSSQLINEQKATVIVEHLTYDRVSDTYNFDIFTHKKIKQEDDQTGIPVNRHIYDYVFTDSLIEQQFVKALDMY